MEAMLLSALTIPTVRLEVNGALAHIMAAISDHCTHTRKITHMISQQSLFDLDGISATPRTVQVSEDGNTISITEDDDGEVSIPEWKLNTGPRQVLSKALCIWKYGIVPCD